MKPFKHIIAGFAICGFALTLSIASVRAAEVVDPKGYPWTSDPAPATDTDSKASGQTAKAPPSKQKWVAHPIIGRTTKGNAAPQETAPRPGKPALAVARKAAPRKAPSTAKASNRRVAYQRSSSAPAFLAQHKTAAAQPVVPTARPAKPLTIHSVVISQKEEPETEALPAPLDLPSAELEFELAVEEDVLVEGNPHPILSLLAPPWRQGAPWQELECCVADFCPLGKVFCALGRVTDYSEFSFGVHSFKDPVDMGSNGNFGLNYGVNLSGALLPWHGIGYQVGGNFLHSDLSGHNTGNVVSSEDRFTAFTTVGVFRRQMDTGLQFGAVWDWRHDEFYQDYDVHQVRGELSYKHQCADEFGVWFTVNTRDDLLRRVDDSSDSIISTNELYAFFYRKSWECGGEGRLYAGFSGESDGIIGGDIRLPVTDNWAIDAQATYLIPDEADGMAGTTAESWGLGISIVWTPKYGGDKGTSYPFRALLPVASPATMMGIFK